MPSAVYVDPSDMPNIQFMIFKQQYKLMFYRSVRVCLFIWFLFLQIFPCAEISACSFIFSLYFAFLPQWWSCSGNTCSHGDTLISVRSLEQKCFVYWHCWCQVFHNRQRSHFLDLMLYGSTLFTMDQLIVNAFLSLTSMNADNK